MESVDIYFDKLIKLIPDIEFFYQTEKNEWFPENPPITLLMSDLARKILDLKLNKDVFQKLFFLIEDGVGSEKIGNAVATGLLETLYFNADNTEKKEFVELMGINSKIYITSISDFYGLSLD